mgnify:CR=1 FL=1
MKVEVECTCCGKRIERTERQVAESKTGRFFCSNACRNKVGGKPRRKPVTPCGQCGEPVYDKQFCSKRCYDEWQGRNRVELTCGLCGKKILVRKSQALHLSGNYCSRACEAEGRMKRPLDRRHNGKPATLDRQGYVRIFEPDHPRAMGGGWIFEHRWVVEQDLGRILDRGEHVHHINGRKDDNRLENLLVLGHSEHSALTAQENRAAREALEAELDEYRRRFGPL